MWKEHLSTLSSECRYSDPASTDEISEAERKLGVVLPDELSSIFAETNGVMGEYGLGLLWPLDRLVEDNLLFRSNSEWSKLYMPFDCLLFFSDAGNGDQFAFSILAGQVRRSDVFVWNHEDDSRTWAAPSLRVFFEWWISGKISTYTMKGLTPRSSGPKSAPCAASGR
jgi:hypothetical protein